MLSRVLHGTGTKDYRINEVRAYDHLILRAVAVHTGAV